MFCFYFQQSESDLSNETCQIKVSNCCANSINFCCCFIFYTTIHTYILYILPKRSGWVGGGGIRKMLGVLMCLDNKVDVHFVSMIFVIYLLCYKYLFTLIAYCTTLIILILYEFIKNISDYKQIYIFGHRLCPPYSPPSTIRRSTGQAVKTLPLCFQFPQEIPLLFYYEC